jgi:hypothetical protein
MDENTKLINLFKYLEANKNLPTKQQFGFKLRERKEYNKWLKRLVAEGYIAAEFDPKRENDPNYIFITGRGLNKLEELENLKD